MICIFIIGTFGLFNSTSASFLQKILKELQIPYDVYIDINNYIQYRYREESDIKHYQAVKEKFGENIISITEGKKGKKNYVHTHLKKEYIEEQIRQNWDNIKSFEIDDDANKLEDIHKSKFPIYLRRIHRIYKKIESPDKYKKYITMRPDINFKNNPKIKEYIKEAYFNNKKSYFTLNWTDYIRLDYFSICNIKDILFDKKTKFSKGQVWDSKIYYYLTSKCDVEFLIADIYGPGKISDNDIRADVCFFNLI